MDLSIIRGIEATIPLGCHLTSKGFISGHASCHCGTTGSTNVQCGVKREAASRSYLSSRDKTIYHDVNNATLAATKCEHIQVGKRINMQKRETQT